MIDKEQIEEMVKAIEKAESQCYPLTYCRKCKYQNIKGHCCFYNYAEKIEKAGYRHIYEVRKETAKEILKELYDEAEGMNNKTVELSAHYIKNTLAKAYGVKL